MVISFVSWLRLAAWACVVALAFLSLLPADELARTSLGGHAEHTLAYAGTAALVRLGYPRASIVRQVLALIVYAGVLEYLQHFSPGRTAAVEDWLASAIGVCIGSAVGWFGARRFR